jgi:VWFA-related protein
VGLVLLSSAAYSGQEPAALPRVEVSRVILEVRVLGSDGAPIPGLRPRDFDLKVDGHRVRVESAAWVDDAPDHGVARAKAPDPASGAGASATPSPPSGPKGRLIVLLFQKDFDSWRLPGLMRVTNLAPELVRMMGPDDRVAVLVFDSQLRLHLDFTSDRQAVERTLSESVLRRYPAPIAPGAVPSLAAHLDPQEARGVAGPEEALRVLARALHPIPGTKLVLFFAWGLGRLSGGVLQPEPDYEPAREALNGAGASVFCLDVTDADWHTLEGGLRMVAEDTGGLYLKTHLGALNAFDRVAQAIAGHYVLGFEPPLRSRGTHQVRLSLAGRRGTVLTRSGYVD